MLWIEIFWEEEFLVFLFCFVIIKYKVILIIKNKIYGIDFFIICVWIYVGLLCM